MKKLMKKRKVDMSAAAVTARVKHACGLGDIEMMATTMRSLVAEIRGENEIPELTILIAEREGRLVK